MVVTGGKVCETKVSPAGENVLLQEMSIRSNEHAEGVGLELHLLW